MEGSDDVERNASMVSIGGWKERVSVETELNIN
jgi:hypothetical protein